MKLFHTSTQFTDRDRAQTENKRELKILRRVINDIFRYKMQIVLKQCVTSLNFLQFQAQIQL